VTADSRLGRKCPVNVIAAIAAVPQTGRVARRVVFVTYPRITALDLVGPHEVFTAAAEVARRTGAEADAYGVAVAAASAGPVRTSRGPAIVADRAFASVRGPIDTLVVVGGEGAEAAALDRQLVEWVRRAATRSRRVASVCSGAFVLAAAGLLDGRRASRSNPSRSSSKTATSGPRRE
jgi:transcriptional regulator GlxA family with amidase domain